MIIRRLITILLMGFSMQQVAADSRGGFGQVITRQGQAVACIFPVEIYQIDGRSVSAAGNSLDVPAGKHTLRAHAILELSQCGNSGAVGGNAGSPVFEIEVEAGMTYYVGFDAGSRNRKDWGLVVWKVKGGHLFDQWPLVSDLSQ